MERYLLILITACLPILAQTPSAIPGGYTPSGAAGGDLSGTYPNPTVSLIGGKAIILVNTFTTAGNFPLILTTTASTNVTLPVSGTLATVGNTPIFIGGYCTGTAASSLANVTVINLGMAANALACTQTYTNGMGDVMPASGTVTALYVTSVTGGTNTSSGVVTVQLNDSAQTVTCTMGTGTSCNDTAHSFSFAAGQRIGLKFTTQSAETLGSVSVGIRAVLN